jgi:isocitrate dehydrogenase (NAD+)
MLDYMGLHEDADRMQNAIEEALKSPENRTKDLGGSAGTKEFAQAVISHL